MIRVSSQMFSRATAELLVSSACLFFRVLLGFYLRPWAQVHAPSRGNCRERLPGAELQGPQQAIQSLPALFGNHVLQIRMTRPQTRFICPDTFRGSDNLNLTRSATGGRLICSCTEFPPCSGNLSSQRPGSQDPSR